MGRHSIGYEPPEETTPARDDATSGGAAHEGRDAQGGQFRGDASISPPSEPYEPGVPGVPEAPSPDGPSTVPAEPPPLAPDEPDDGSVPPHESWRAAGVM